MCVCEWGEGRGEVSRECVCEWGEGRGEVSRECVYV